MTIEEARRFIEEAERLPVEEIDGAKLAQARQAVFLQDTGYERRADVLIAKLLDRRSNVQSALEQSIEEVEAARQAVAEAATPGQLRPMHQGSAVPRADDSHRLISRALEQRLREAAAGAGVPDAEVDALISQTEAVLAQAASQGQGDMVTAEMLLGNTLANWEQQAAANAPRAIGVPPGFTAEVTEPPPQGFGAFGAASVPRVIEQEPRYFEGDEIAPASMAPEQISQIQRQLVEAGLLETGKYWEGFWDDATASAYATVLGYSNQRGTEWQNTLQDLIDSVPDELKEQRARAAVADVFQEPAYRKPDYATLAQDVKQMFRAKLGRDPSDEELAEMAGALSGSWRAAHDAAVAAARAEFDTEQRLFDRALAGEEPPESVAAGSFTAVDPAARFAELFEQRFKPEINRLESLGRVRENTQNVFASLSTMQSMIGGN